MSINYCEVGPKLHALSAVYNSSTGEGTVDVTYSSYSGHAKVLESSEPLSVESVSDYRLKSAGVEKRKKITDEGSYVQLNYTNFENM